MDAVEQAAELGRANQRVIGMITRHCAHARVERSPMGGVSMVEQMTSLPISMREVHCQHASKPSGAGSNLEWIAVEFYRNNCVDCPLRKMQASPNLADFVEDIDRRHAAGAAREAEAATLANQQRAQRATARDESTRHEAPATRNLIGLLDRIDAEAPDVEAGRELLETVRAAPELCTPAAIEVLMDTARELRGGVLLAVADALAERDLVPRQSVVELAVAALSEGGDHEAAKIIASPVYGATIDASTLKAAATTIIRMAGGFSDHGIDLPTRPRTTRWAAAFGVPVTRDLPGALAVIEGMLEHPTDDYTRGRAAAAATLLVQIEPNVIPVLSSQLVAALRLPGAVERPRFGEDRSSAHITDALTACLLLNPTDTAAAMERGPSAALSDDQLDALFDAYDRTIRRNMSSEVPLEVGAVVASACLKRLSGDWGIDARRAGGDTLSLMGKYHPELLVDRIPALVAALMDEVRSPESAYHPLTDFSPQPNPLRGLEAMSERSSRAGRLQDLRTAIGGTVALRPQEVFDHITPFTAPTERDTDEMIHMREQAVELLGAIGSQPKMLPQVLPMLYRALLDVHGSVRASGVRAWDDLARRHSTAKLPRELSALIPQMLTDPYTHQSLVRALRFHLDPVGSDLPVIVATLIQLGDAVGSTLLEEILDSTLKLSTTLPSPVPANVARKVIGQAHRLPPYELPGFLRSHRRRLRAHPEYVDLALIMLGSPEAQGISYGEDALVRCDLRDAGRSVIAAKVAAITEVAKGYLPHSVGPALEFVEILQSAGCWEEAQRLADEVVSAIPDTVETAVIRSAAERVAAAAQLELAVRDGDVQLAALSIDRWKKAEQRYGQATETARNPRWPI